MLATTDCDCFPKDQVLLWSYHAESLKIQPGNILFFSFKYQLPGLASLINLGKHSPEKQYLTHSTTAKEAA